ncbi:MAG: hypothetical protein R3324_00575 [Halobacteriales archaeon]|nr:hypothetical protein [Halobacteriales archaeon]
MRPANVSSSEIVTLLGMVRGVSGADVVLGERGEIESIEIAVQPGSDTRRIIRDVESALYTGLGIVIDHRTIAVVANGSGNGRKNGDVAHDLHILSTGTGVEGENARVPRIELVSVQLDPDGELFCDVVVELSRGDEVYAASERDADTPRARMNAAGKATIEALADSLTRETAFSLEGIEEFAICENPALIASIRVRRGRTLRTFLGTSLIEGPAEEAAARAVLDALNRFWLVESDSTR